MVGFAASGLLRRAAKQGRVVVLAAVLPWSVGAQTNVYFEPIGQWPTPGRDTQRVTVEGNYAYVGTDTALEIINVANPANPQRVGSYPVAVTAVRVRGTNAFLATDGGLLILDVGDPTTPRLLGESTNTYLVDLEISGNYVFATASSIGFAVFDIADLTHPTLVTNLFVNIPLASIRVRNGLAYCSSFYPQLMTISVQQPAQPVVLGTGPGGDGDVDLAGDFAFVSDVVEGLRVVNVSDPAHPASVTKWPATNLFATASCLDGAHALVVETFGGVYAVDISNPAQPAQVGFYAGPAYAHDIDTAGSYAYIAGGEAGLVILRIVKQRFSLVEALDDPNLAWTTTGSSGRSWRPQTSITHDGIDAAEGGPIQAGVIAAFTTLRTSVVGPGTIRFWWLLENGSCFRFRFLIDNVTKVTLSRGLPGFDLWEPSEVVVPAGAHDLVWRFETFCGDGSPPGRAWVDQVSFVPLALKIVSQNATSIVVQVTGPAGYTVQLEASSDLASWTRDGIETVTLGSAPAVVRIAKTQSRGFYRGAVLSP